MRRSVRWRYLAGFASVLLILAVVGGFAYRTASSGLSRAVATRGAGDEVIRFGELLSRMDEVQAAVRGFAIAGQPSFLGPYDSAVARVPALVADLRRMAANDTLEQRTLDSLVALIDNRMAASDTIIRLRRSAGAAAALHEIAVGTGTATADAIRRHLRTLERAHEAERERNIAALQASVRATRRVVLAGWLAALLAAAAASVFAHVGLRTRERADARARDLAAELQDLYDHAPVGYHSHDEYGVFVRMNRTELSWLGYEPSEILGRMRFSDLLAPASREGFELNFEHFKATGEVREHAYNLFRKDGTILPVVVSATLVRDVAGGYVMSRGVTVDVSERRRMEAEVKTLSGLLPICSSCKKIRDDHGRWRQIESYVREHSEAEFSHGLCPECLRRLYPDVAPEGGT